MNRFKTKGTIISLPVTYEEEDNNPISYCEILIEKSLSNEITEIHLVEIYLEFDDAISILARCKKGDAIEISGYISKAETSEEEKYIVEEVNF